MVSQGRVSGTEDIAGHLNDLAEVMRELQKYRKLITKNYKHKVHGGEMQALMWALNSNDELCVVLCSTAMSQIKQVLTAREFFDRYTSSDIERAALMAQERDTLNGYNDSTVDVP